MVQQLSTVEAFAHFIRGAITLFFVFWCIKLYTYRHRNRMMRLLFYTTIFFVFSYIKDSVFLFAQWKKLLLAQWFCHHCRPSVHTSCQCLLHRSHQSWLSHSPSVSRIVVYAGVIHTAILDFPRWNRGFLRFFSCSCRGCGNHVPRSSVLGEVSTIYKTQLFL